MHPDLERAATTAGAVAYGHLVGVLDDAAHQVLERLVEHGQPSSLTVSVSGRAVVSSTAGAP